MVNSGRPSVCDCAELGIEIWLDTFGCDCSARPLNRFTDLQAQRELSTTGAGQLSFPIGEVGNLAEVWPNQTAVIVKVCDRVIYAGVVKEIGLDAGIVQLGLQTWDEWLAFRYLHENVVLGKPQVPVYDAAGNVLKADLGDDAPDAYCELPGLNISAAAMLARLVQYAASPNPANNTGSAVTLGDSGPDRRNGLFQGTFCVPSIQAVVQAPSSVQTDYAANWCDGHTIFDTIGDIVGQSGVEWITDAVQTPDGCWTYRFTASDRIGATVPLPVYAPGSSLTITPVEYTAQWNMAGSTCYPPNCPDGPRWPAGEKQWGGAFVTNLSPTRAIREQFVDQGEFTQAQAAGTTAQVSASLRTGAAQALQDNPPRDSVEVKLNLTADRVCQEGVDIGGVVQVDLGADAGCFLGEMRIRADSFTANASDGLQRELTLDPESVSTTSFSNECGDCSDC